MNRNLLFGLVSVTIIVGMFLGACVAPPAEEPTPTEPSYIMENPFPPSGQILTAHDLLILTPELIAKMEPIENNTITAAQLDSVGGLIQFSGVGENLLQVGQIINSGVDPKTPDGLLRIVESVESEDGITRAITRQATLEEAIQDGNFSVSYSQFTSSVSQPGGGKLMRVVPYPVQITRPVDVVLYEDGEGGRVTAKGEITVIPDFDLSVEVSDLKMKFFEFVNKTTVEADITIDSGVEYSIHEEKVVFEISLGTLNVPVKGMKIPMTGEPLVIVLQPQLVVTVGLDGQVHAGVEMEGVYTNTIEARATWMEENGDWEVSKNSNPRFEFIPPTFKTEAHAKVFAKPRLQLMLFGIVGPYVQIEGYYRFDATPQKNPQKNPWWTLRVGLEGEIGVSVKFKLFDFVEVYPLGEPITIFDEIIKQGPLEESPPAAEAPEEVIPTEEVYIPPLPPEETNPPVENAPADTSPPVTTGNENVLIVYDKTSAFVINMSQSDVTVKGLVFNRIDNQGNITASYQADIWGNFYSGYDPVHPGYCLRIALPNSSTSPDCIIQVNYETRQETYHFWKETSTSRQFQVWQNNTLIQTCEISAGSCSFYLPQP